MAIAELSDDTVRRLQLLAVPLHDTFDTVVSRLLNHWEKTAFVHKEFAAQGQPNRVLDDGTLEFSSDNLPDVSFTTCNAISVRGVLLPKESTNWNALMCLLIEHAGLKGVSARDILNTLNVNAKSGKFEINGYRYIPGAGVSVQGQDANSALRQISELANTYGLPVTILFRWQSNDRADFPNQRGVLALGPQK